MPRASDPPMIDVDTSGAGSSPSAPSPSAQLSGEALARRKLLKQAGWVLPAIVTTVTVSGRAAQATCTPRCSPSTPVNCSPLTCNPISCNPANCNPNGGACGPSSCRPRR